RVDGVFQLQNLAARVHGDARGQIAFRHGGRHARDVADLVGQVAGHGVDAFGQISPGSGDGGDYSLTAQFAFGSYFARNARHFAREGIQLLHHGVDHARGVQEFAAQWTAVHLQSHGLREIAFGHRADHARDFRGRLHQVANKAVHRLHALRPSPGHRANGSTLGDFAVLTDGPADALEFAGHLLVDFEDVVQRVGDLALYPRLIYRHPYREVAPLKRN